MKKPDAILTSDWHLREDTPTCRTDNFWDAQWKKVSYLRELQQKYDCPVFHAGDLFHHWKPSPYLLSTSMLFLPYQFYSVHGQHDLPQHSMELSYKSGMTTLVQSNHVITQDRNWKFANIHFCHWGMEPDKKAEQGKVNILIWHHMTYTKKPFPGASGGNAAGILRKYPQYDLIITGDNHVSFTEEYKGRLLVNPGNITRQAADQIDFRPRVALWYASDNSIEWEYLPIEKDVISREHIDVIQKRDERIDAFISKLNDDWQAELSFEENLKRFLQVNDVRKSVKHIIYKSIES